MKKKINSYSQINVKKNNYTKKGDNLKQKSLKNKEKIESSNKVKVVPKNENLYRSDKKKFKKITSITVSEHKKKFKHGRARNLHKRGSKYKIRKLRKKHICQKPDRKRLKSQCKIATIYGECVVCLENKEMSSINTIKCGNVPHVLCSDCKDKIKDNKCPLCRSHPIDPNKTQLITRNSSYDIYTPDILIPRISRVTTTPVDPWPRIARVNMRNFIENQIIYDNYPPNNFPPGMGRTYMINFTSN